MNPEQHKLRGPMGSTFFSGPRIPMEFHDPRDAHLRQAALDAEVQAKVGQEELKEDLGSRKHG